MVAAVQRWGVVPNRDNDFAMILFN